MSNDLKPVEINTASLKAVYTPPALDVPPGTLDVTSHRIVVGSLAATVVLCVVCSTVLAALGHPMPHFLTTLGGGAMASLANLAYAIMRGA